MKNFTVSLLMLTSLCLVNIQAEQVQISQIKITRQGDTTFSVSFMVGSNNLQVSGIPNNTPKAEVLQRIKSEITRWKEQVAESNVLDICATYEGKTVTINVP